MTTTMMTNWIDERARQGLGRVHQARAAGLYPYFKPFASGGIRTSVDGHPILNFSSNDYLGLTSHPEVLVAAQEAIDRFSCGLSSSRLQATTTEHVALEARLARFFGFEAALITTTGYQASVGLISALADRDTVVVLDRLAHASLLDGAFLAAGAPGGGPQLRFAPHNDPEGLERILAARRRKDALVLVEGIYSMDGDVGALPEIVGVCARHEAVLAVDDAHGSGTLGTHGRGALEHFGLEGRVPLVVTTFSKTFGGIGGVILGSRDCIDFLRHHARAFVFSAALPVPILAAASTILDMLEAADGPVLVLELHAKAAYMYARLTARGFDLGPSATHVMPIMIRDEAVACALHRDLYAAGYYLVPLTYPAVPRGEERLRLNVTRGHSYEELDGLVETLTTLGRRWSLAASGASPREPLRAHAA
jgi:7-keto-8-aminopelargonate synthetase-like enzyme